MLARLDGGDPVPMGRIMSKRALLLVNRKARKGQEDRAALLDQLAGHGLELVEAAPGSAAELSAVIRRHREQVDLVIVGGGDGTLNAAADGLVDAGLPLGILPLGTANDLARTLGIPTDPAEACQVIAAGCRRRIDLGWVNGKHYFNVAGIGLTAQITRQLSRGTKRRWGVLAYAVTAVRTLWNARPFHAEIRGTDGQIHAIKAVQITVGNGRHYGGGMTVSEDATIDDGHLDLISVEVAHWWQVVALLPALRWGRLASWSSVRTLRGHAFEVLTRRPRQVATDGEIITQTPAHFRIVPQALEVFVPPAAEPQRDGTASISATPAPV